MKTEWDYTDLAAAYLKRQDYAQCAIDKMFEVSGVQKGDNACDVGAGAAHLTLKLAEYGLHVYAVEPNDAMRANGIKRTSKYADVQWFEGVGEHTGMESNKFNLVTFGSLWMRGLLLVSILWKFRRDMFLSWAITGRFLRTAGQVK